MSDADLYRLIVEHSPLALSYHTAEGAFLLASPACRDIFGCSPEELLGRALDEVVAPEDAEGVRLRWADAQRGAQAPRARYRLRRRGPPTRWVETTMRAVPGGGGVVCSSRDVSAEELAAEEEAARRARAELAEEHRDNLVAMVPGIVWYGPISPDLKRYSVTYANDYFERVTGYGAREWIETPGFWVKILHPEDKERVLEQASRPLADGDPGLVYRIFGKDGRTIWLQSHMRIQRDATGTPVRRYGLTLDVTTYKAAEHAVNELLRRTTVLKERIDDLVSTVPGIVWETWAEEDQGGGTGERTRQAGFCSDYVERLTGYTPDEWARQPSAWLELMPAEDRAAARAAMDRLIAEGGGSIEHRLITKDGREIWLANHMVIGRDAAGARSWTRGVALDITARKLAEQARERLEREVARQAARVAELSTPLIPVSDEIMVMPLVGTIDPARATNILTCLLRGLCDAKAKAAILDVTGVAALDAESAAALIRAASAARLLGARVLVTGVRPEVARTLIALGLDLRGIETRGNLAGAFAELAGGARPVRVTSREKPDKAR